MHLPILAPQDWWPVYSPDGTDIAFTRVDGRTMTLEVVDLATKHTVRIAANEGQLGPSWSSDGRLAFSLGAKIYTANADGSGRTRVTSRGKAYAPAWRPHSTDIAYLTTVGATNTDLWVSGVLWARDAIGTPVWSPDGSQLAFERDDGIYVATGPNAERKVVSVPNPRKPSWSPDGVRLAYVAARRIWIAPTDGSASPQALTSTFGLVTDPSWSREGDAVAYEARGAVEITYLDGHTARLIASDDAGAAFSPVSDTLVFTGGRPGCPGHVVLRVYYDNAFNGPVTGSCEIDGTPRGDVIRGTGLGGDVIVAGAGNDSIHARNGHRDTILCGPGRDTVYADQGDALRGCEIVHRR